MKAIPWRWEKLMVIAAIAATVNFLKRLIV